MENIDKKLKFETNRENEYAGEEIRIAGILKEKMSEDEAALVVYKLEKLAKENDEVVAKILVHPKVVERYDVDTYDGLELHPKAPVQLPLHFIRDGLWKIKNLNENNLFVQGFFNQDGTYGADALLSWFRKDVDFNKLRLEQLEETGNLMVTDPTKVRIKKVKLTEKEPQKEEIIH